ncbi:MAG: hypothetical protein ACRD1R_03665 [Acidobacteriota bacterium]
MGRVTAQVTVSNVLDPESTMTFGALVDAGTSILVLPSDWKDRLGPFSASTIEMVEVADQRLIEAEISGPVKIQIEGFRAIFNEVTFPDMQPANGQYEPLLGYIILVLRNINKCAIVASRVPYECGLMARRDEGAYREYGVFSVARQLPIPDRRLPRALNTGQIASSDSALIYVTKH